jgi:orotate phosphoribosyltransferase
MSNLFRHGTFALHSGGVTQFLINAQALTESDLVALATLVAPALRPFGSVYGIPRGGVRFAKALEPFIDMEGRGPRLIVDDVLTTGASFDDIWEPNDKGVVIFNRGLPKEGVLSIFSMYGGLR